MVKSGGGIDAHRQALSLEKMKNAILRPYGEVTNIKIYAPLLITLVLISGCADLNQAASVSGNTESKDYVSPKLTDQAAVYFYAGPGVYWGVYITENGENVAAMRDGGFTYFLAEPGTHTYSVHHREDALVTLDLQPGESYFVRFSLTTGMFPYGLLEIVPAMTGKSAIRNMRYARMQQE